MIQSIPIVNMSYLGDSFQIITGQGRNSNISADLRSTNPNDPDYMIHPTMRGSKRIHLVLLYFIPGEDLEDNTSVQDPTHWPRIASIRVPRGCPISKLRPFIRAMEQELKDIYGKAERCSISLVATEGTDVWKYIHELPTFDVVYV